MTFSQQPQQAADDSVEAVVTDFLIRNPQFLRQHPDLLAQLDIPHPCGAAVSLLEYQARVLRERNRQLQQRLDELLAVARDNDRLAERIHHLTLELISAPHLEAVLFVLKDELRRNFDCDAIVIRLLGSGDGPDWVAPEAPELELFAPLLKAPRPLCGRLTREQLHFLFGDSAVAIGSTALVPLFDGRLLGLLAIGSYWPERFQPGMGTVFLRQLGAVAGRALQRYLPAAP
ncbi:MAG: DUF484 family protein [Xanthomonadaceae bacterium]|nr:DUF484 family protein [Xanthomonadaceae bacterium]